MTDPYQPVEQNAIAYTPTILVIDDDQSILPSLTQYITEKGYKALNASTAMQGLEHIKQHQPQVLVLDLELPDLQGLELLEKIQKEYPDIQTIIISGIGKMNDVIVALRLGAWDYLTKPIINLEILYNSIQKACAHYDLIIKNRVYVDHIAQHLQVLKEDQQAGHGVQKKLLPHNNIRYGNYTFNHEINPLIYLSGDFIEYFSINHTKVAVYLADVSGHGVSSAFITILLRSLIEQIYTRYQFHSDQTIYYPDKVFEELSYEIYMAKFGKYMTMIYGVLDLTTNIFTYSIAGHYPNPILLTQDNQAKYLPGKGFPVGILKNSFYESHEILVPVGGSIILFSDGIMESILPSEKTELKDTELLKLVSQYKTDITKFHKYINNTKQLDDVSLLTICRDLK